MKKTLKEVGTYQGRGVQQMLASRSDRIATISGVGFEFSQAYLINPSPTVDRTWWKHQVWQRVAFCVDPTSKTWEVIDVRRDRITQVS